MVCRTAVQRRCQRLNCLSSTCAHSWVCEWRPRPCNILPAPTRCPSLSLCCNLYLLVSDKRTTPVIRQGALADLHLAGVCRPHGLRAWHHNTNSQLGGCFKLASTGAAQVVTPPTVGYTYDHCNCQPSGSTGCRPVDLLLRKITCNGQCKVALENFSEGSAADDNCAARVHRPGPSVR